MMRPEQMRTKKHSIGASLSVVVLCCRAVYWGVLVQGFIVRSLCLGALSPYPLPRSRDLSLSLSLSRSL
jgi:hypothetical protein